MIALEHLSKAYGKTEAVKALSLLVRPGEVFGFIGPNGAGKTTTLRMMGGVLTPDAGTVHICGISMGERPREAKQRIGFIPDRPFIYEKLTGFEFLMFIADLYRMDRKVFPGRAGEMLELFSLAPFGDELIESYSHGMKQRLIMAAALLHDPDVFIVDEPMVGLDPMAIRLVKDLFRQLAAEGKTVFISTHTLKVAEEVCDRIGIIQKGVLLAEGTPGELMARAAHGARDLESAFLELTLQ